MNREKRVMAVAISIIAIVLLVFGLFSLTGRIGYGPRMMGGYSTEQTFGMMGGYSRYGNIADTKSEAEINADIEAAQANAQIDAVENTITYTGSDITVVIMGGPEEADEKFVINGLVNPTLYIPKDAAVTLEFVNVDEGMPHAFEITNAEPPYFYMAMMSGGVYPGSIIGTLPAADNGQYPTETITFTAGIAGTFYYICQYPGHAQEGMYGTIIIA